MAHVARRRDRPVARRRRWSSFGAGPPSTGCACRSRSSRSLCRACCRRRSPKQRPFDAPGAVLLAACMSALLLALVLSQRPSVPGWLAALFAAALRCSLSTSGARARVAEPIIRPALFADAAFAVPNVMNVLANLAGFAILLLTPILPRERPQALRADERLRAGAGLQRRPGRRAARRACWCRASAAARRLSPVSCRRARPAAAGLHDGRDRGAGGGCCC